MKQERVGGICGDGLFLQSGSSILNMDQFVCIMALVRKVEPSSVGTTSVFFRTLWGQITFESCL